MCDRTEGSSPTCAVGGACFGVTRWKTLKKAQERCKARRAEISAIDVSVAIARGESPTYCVSQ